MRTRSGLGSASVVGLESGVGLREESWIGVSVRPEAGRGGVGVVTAGTGMGYGDGGRTGRRLRVVMPVLDDWQGCLIRLGTVLPLGQGQELSGRSGLPSWALLSHPDDSWGMLGD